MNTIIIKRREPIWIILINIICILILISCGSGGGDGSRDTTIDNSHFYGEYAMWIRTDGCDISYSKLTIGGDPSRVSEENYLFVPQDSNSASNSWTDEDCNLSRAVTALEDVICHVEETIAITGETPVIDVKTTKTGTTLFDDELLKIPETRDAWKIFESLPGVQADRINIAGERTSNSDGVCVGELVGELIEKDSLGFEIGSHLNLIRAPYLTKYAPSSI